VVVVLPLGLPVWVETPAGGCVFVVKPLFFEFLVEDPAESAIARTVNRSFSLAHVCEVKAGQDGIFSRFLAFSERQLRLISIVLMIMVFIVGTDVHSGLTRCINA
jgi:hypothetical protein